MRAKVLVFVSLWLLLGAAYLAQPLPASPKGKRYVNKKAGFRVQLPPGWRKIKSKEIPNALAAFAPKDKSVAVVVQRTAGTVNPRDAMAGIGKLLESMSFRKISEEAAVVSGLPARKLVYATPPGREPGRMSYTLVFGQGEWWNLLATGPERLLVTPEEPRYQELQQLMGSFEFLEPVLGRLKAGLTTPGVTGTTVEEVAEGQRYYINDNLGMKILLPPDWVLLSEQAGSFQQPAQVVLGKQGTMARVMLTREIVEASLDLYVKLGKKLFNENLLVYRLVSDEKVSRAKLEGRSLVILGKQDDIQWRYWVEIFSAGEEHFRISAFAPEEVFERYSGAFKEMMSSVQFPTLANRLPATDALLPEQGGSLPPETKPGGAPEQKPSELERLRKAVVRNPGDVKARLALAAALAESGNTEGRITELQAATRLAPNFPPAHRRLGLAYLEKELYDEAIASYKRAVKLKPDDEYTHTNLGDAYREKGLYDEAIASCKRAVKLKPDDAYGHNRLGLAYESKGLYDEAIASYKKAVKLKPDYVFAHTKLGDAYREKGLYDEAIASCKRAVKLKPDDAYGHSRLGLAYESKGLYDEAIASYKKAVKLKPDYVYTHVNLGDAYRKKGLHDKAIASYKRAVKVKPDDAYAHVNLGDTYRKKGLDDEAIASYKRAVKVKPDYAYGHSRLGLAYESKGLHDEAIASYKRAVKVKPDYVYAHVNLGDAYRKKGLHDEAIASYKRALDIKPDYGLLLALDLEGTEEVVAAFNAWSQVSPAGVSQLKIRTIRRLLERAGDLQGGDGVQFDIHEILDRVNYSSPEPLTRTEWLRVEHARLLLARGRVEDAVRRLEGVGGVMAHIKVGVDRAFDPVRTALGEIDLTALAEREIEDAIAAAEANPRLLKARLLVVQAYRRAGRTADGLATADAALAAAAADPTQFDDEGKVLNWLHNARAYALYALGRNEEGRSAMRAAIDTGEQEDPNVSQVINLSSLLVDEGRPEEALATLKTVGRPSDYGNMFVEMVRACAAAQTDDAVMLDETLAYLREHEDDNVRALQRGLICANELDEAAALYLKRLADTDQRADLLVRLQNWQEDPLLDLPFLTELRRRRVVIRARPDVQAAIAAVGRVQDLPFPDF